MCGQHAVFQQGWGFYSLHSFVCNQQIHICYWHTTKNVSKTRRISTRFGFCDQQEVHLDHVRKAAGKCKRGVKTKVTSLDALSDIKVPSANDSDAS